jgi:AbrB family looped-hinge helix DNA binding protein
MPYITSKGQVTVPKAVREALGIGEGDRVEFVVRGREAVLVKRERRSILGMGGVAAPRARKAKADAKR